MGFPTHITLEGCVFIDAKSWRINPIERSIIVPRYVHIYATAIHITPIYGAIFLFYMRKPGPLGKVRDHWLCLIR
jgi:hypothetical protein